MKFFAHTRKKHWESGNFYLLPSIRIHWEEDKDYDFNLGRFIPVTRVRLDILFLTFRISI